MARADATLVLDLPPSRVQTASTLSPSSESSSAAKSANATAARGAAAQAGSVPDRRGGLRRPRNEKVVGRLGVSTRSAVIRAGRSSRKHVLAKIPAGLYMALTDSRNGWYGVLMADRSTGWILSRDVKVLDWEVVSSESTEAPRYTDYSSGANMPLLTGGQQNILSIAQGYLGVPYRWGGTSPNGLDCSAFVQRCFAALGIRLPRTAREQIHYGLPVRPEELQPADRIYFASRDGRITHTGIYMGNGYFIHASRSRGGVAVNRLTEPMYWRMYAGARR